jgi:chromosome segregation ATPase
MRYALFTAIVLGALLSLAMGVALYERLRTASAEAVIAAQRAQILENSIADTESTIRQMKSEQRSGWQDFEGSKAVAISVEIQQRKRELAAYRDELAAAEQQLTTLVDERIRRLRLLFVPLGALFVAMVVFAIMTFPRRQHLGSG